MEYIVTTPCGTLRGVAGKTAGTAHVFVHIHVGAVDEIQRAGIVGNIDLQMIFHR